MGYFKRLRELLFGEVVPPFYVPDEQKFKSGGGGASACIIVVGAAGGGGAMQSSAEVSGKRVPFPGGVEIRPNTPPGLTLTLPAGYEVGRNVTIAGHVLVPVEPTDEMINAFYDDFEPPEIIRKEFIERYKAMIGVVRK